MPFGLTQPARTVPKAGEDADTAKQIAGRTAPNMPDRDGPARDKVEGAPTPRKATSAKAKGTVKGKPGKKTLASMKASIKGMG